MDDQRDFFDALIGDGTSLIKLTGLALIGSGLFVILLGMRGEFLPHDIDFLGSSVHTLRSIAESRLVYFMIHDRIAFGGTLLGIGTLYLWLAEFPLRDGKAWAWWTLLLSGIQGFGSFLSYLGYGYLDTWHGIATLALLPIFSMGLIRSYRLLNHPRSIASLLRRDYQGVLRSRFGIGRLFLLVTAVCLFIGGVIISIVGATTVFVTEDLQYLQIQPADLNNFNPRLIPLIAHDRAGFGGGVCCCGLTMFFCLLCGAPSRSLWQALLITGLTGFGPAIGVHYPIGYTCFTHLAPAYLGAGMFTTGIVLTYTRMVRGSSGAETTLANP